MVDKPTPSGVRPIGGNLSNVNFLTVAEERRFAAEPVGATSDTAETRGASG
jgi:hypothetical protein